VIGDFLLVLAGLWALAALAAYLLRGRFGPTSYRELLATWFYLPATMGFFWQLAFVPGTFVPKGGGDLASFIYPVYSFAARTWQQGVVPLWNPYLYAGSPFAADMQSGVFYPVNMIAFLLARPFTYTTVETLAVVHFLLAAVFAYIYGRGLGLGRIGAFGVGLVFAYGGFNVAHLGHLNMLEAVAWPTQPEFQTGVKLLLPQSAYAGGAHGFTFSLLALLNAASP